MDPQVISWIVSLIAGSAGGNVVGALLKNRNLGPMLNTVLGAVGGGLGGQVLPLRAFAQRGAALIRQNRSWAPAGA